MSICVLLRIPSLLNPHAVCFSGVSVPTDPQPRSGCCSCLLFSGPHFITMTVFLQQCNLCVTAMCFSAHLITLSPYEAQHIHEHAVQSHLEGKIVVHILLARGIIVNNDVCLCSAIELESDLLLLLMDMVFSLLIGGELGLAHQLRSNILSKMEQRWQLIGSPQSLRPLAARGVAARYL